MKLSHVDEGSGAHREGNLGTTASAVVAPEVSSLDELDRRRRAHAGPKTDLGVLFDTHAQFLVRVVRRMVGTTERAEDVVQRVFMTAHRKGLPDGDPDRIRAWLYRVAMNEVRHERRSLARRMRLARAVQHQASSAEPPQSPSEHFESAADARAVREVIARLPHPQREVFVLYELEEVSGSEIAKLLNVSENTVWSRLRLARARFKKHWARRAGERG